MPISVLHIEDNPGDAMLLRAMLLAADEAGFELVHVSRLSAGLEQIADAHGSAVEISAAHTWIELNG